MNETWHDLTLVGVGERLEIHIDGNLVASYDDPDPLPPGTVGLENLTGTVWYDDILICELIP